MIRLVLFCARFFVTFQSRLNFYGIDRFTDINALQFDCLKFYLESMDGMIEYCRHPNGTKNQWLRGPRNIHDKNYTFDELDRLNITSKDLLS
jgi:hypothetical protein